MFSKAEQDNRLPFVSVVVPTLNRKKLLRNCLNSLSKLNYPKSRFEVIVVDGGSIDGTKEMVRKDFSEVRFIPEERKGVVYARNTGWKHAKGLIVAYTDDDCIVDREWLRSLVYGFTSRKIGAVGGPIFHLHPELIHKRYWGPPFGPFYLGERKRLVKGNLVTSNFAVRREVFEKVKFDVSLVYHDSEDADLCKSMMETGYKLLYIPDAKVYHNIDPRRVVLTRNIKRAFFGGISLYIVERKRCAGIVLTARFLRLFLGASLVFFVKRRVRDFHWLIKCYIAFLASVMLICS